MKQKGLLSLLQGLEMEKKSHLVSMPGHKNMTARHQLDDMQGCAETNHNEGMQRCGDKEPQRLHSSRPSHLHPLQIWYQTLHSDFQKTSGFDALI